MRFSGNQYFVIKRELFPRHDTLDLLGHARFIWITAQPIVDIVIQGHSPIRFVCISHGANRTSSQVQAGCVGRRVPALIERWILGWVWA